MAWIGPSAIILRSAVGERGCQPAAGCWPLLIGWLDFQFVVIKLSLNLCVFCFVQ